VVEQASQHLLHTKWLSTVMLRLTELSQNAQQVVFFGGAVAADVKEMQQTWTAQHRVVNARTTNYCDQSPPPENVSNTEQQTWMV